MTHDTGGVLGLVATPFIAQVLSTPLPFYCSHMTHDTGGVLGLVATPFIAQVCGFSSTFMAAGLAGALWAVGGWLCLPPYERDLSGADSNESGPSQSSSGATGSNRSSGSISPSHASSGIASDGSSGGGSRADNVSISAGGGGCEGVGLNGGSAGLRVNSNGGSSTSYASSGSSTNSSSSSSSSSSSGDSAGLGVCEEQFAGGGGSRVSGGANALQGAGLSRSSTATGVADRVSASVLAPVRPMEEAYQPSRSAPTLTPISTLQQQQQQQENELLDGLPEDTQLLQGPVYQQGGQDEGQGILQAKGQTERAGPTMGVQTSQLPQSSQSAQPSTNGSSASSSSGHIQGQPQPSLPGVNGSSSSSSSGSGSGSGGHTGGHPPVLGQVLVLCWAHAVR